MEKKVAFGSVCQTYLNVWTFDAKLVINTRKLWNTYRYTFKKSITYYKKIKPIKQKEMMKMMIFNDKSKELELQALA